MLAVLQKSALSLARAHHPSRSRWLGLCIPEKSIPEAGGVGLLEAGRGKVVSAVVVALVLVLMVCVYVSVSLCVCVCVCRPRTSDHFLSHSVSVYHFLSHSVSVPQSLTLSVSHFLSLSFVNLHFQSQFFSVS